MKRRVSQMVLAMACAAVAAVPPTLQEADVVVVGGTVDGVRAAIAAKKAGASVFLVAPRAYLAPPRSSWTACRPTTRPIPSSARFSIRSMRSRSRLWQRFPRTSPMRPGSC